MPYYGCGDGNVGGGGEGSTATVEKVAIVAAKKACAGWVAVMQHIMFKSDFFLTVTATTTEGQGHGAVSSRKAHPEHLVIVAVIDAPLLASN